MHSPFRRSTCDRSHASRLRAGFIRIFPDRSTCPFKPRQGFTTRSFLSHMICVSAPNCPTPRFSHPKLPESYPKSTCRTYRMITQTTRPGILSVRIDSIPAGSTPLAQANLSMDLSPATDGRGKAITLDLDQSIRLDPGKTYNLTILLTEDQPVSRFDRQVNLFFDTSNGTASPFAQTVQSAQTTIYSLHSRGARFSSTGRRDAGYGFPG